jgi:MFS family permease
MPDADYITGLYVPFFYVAQYAEQKIHTSTSRSFEILAVMNAGSFLGRPIPGILADVFGRYNLMIPSTAISGVLCITLWLLADDFASIISFAALYGFFSGALVSLTPPCIAQISKPSEMGGRIGLAYTLMSFS